PVQNAGISSCIRNTISAPASGNLDTSTGVAVLSLAFNAGVTVTGNAVQPCPLCRQGTTSGPACAGTPQSPCVGVCEGSPNQGAACTSTNSTGLSRDCALPASNVCYKGSNNGAACTSSAECP